MEMKLDRPHRIVSDQEKLRRRNRIGCEWGAVPELVRTLDPRKWYATPLSPDAHQKR